MVVRLLIAPWFCCFDLFSFVPRYNCHLSSLAGQNAKGTNASTTKEENECYTAEESKTDLCRYESEYKKDEVAHKE